MTHRSSKTKRDEFNKILVKVRDTEKAGKTSTVCYMIWTLSFYWMGKRGAEHECRYKYKSIYINLYRMHQQTKEKN